MVIDYTYDVTEQKVLPWLAEILCVALQLTPTQTQTANICTSQIRTYRSVHMARLRQVYSMSMTDIYRV